MRKPMFLVPLVLVLVLLFAGAAQAHHKCGHKGKVCPPPPTSSPPSPPPSPTPPPPSPSTNPFAGATLYVDTVYNPARRAADQWYASGRTADAQQLEKIAQTPNARWFHNIQPGEWGYGAYVDRATAAGQMPVLIIYSIPYRDCGGYSAGGLPASQYRGFIDDVANAIGSRKAIVIVEPDALPGLDCLSAELQQERIDLLNYAITKFKSNASTYVYIDAGNPTWHPASTMIDRLKRVGVDKADGFSLNVGNYYPNSMNITYGKEVSAGVANKPFIIDTGRNGNGHYTGGVHSGDCQPWFNPPGRALGDRAGHVTPSDPAVHGYIWGAYPGQSDANCDGYAAPGVFMPERGLELAKNASWHL